jgi:hypothetical protein
VAKSFRESIEEVQQQQQPITPEIEQQEQPSQKKMTFRDSVETPTTPSSEPSRARSLAGAFPKGTAKTLSEEMNKVFDLFGINREVVPYSKEEFNKNIEELLPTQDKFLERGLERGGRNAPYAIGPGGPIQGAIRAGVGGLGAEAVKEVGGPEWAQTLMELLGFGAPKFGKKITPNANQKELVEGGRGLGLTESQIAPLIQSEGKQKWFTKLAPKRGRSQRVLADVKSGFDKVYTNLAGRPEAQRLLTPQEVQQFTKDIHPAIQQLPADLREIAAKEAFDLAKGGMTRSKLINFWQDLNHHISNGHEKLGLLKDSVSKAIGRNAPELAKDFQMTNQLYSKYATIRSRLKPSLVSDLWTASKALRTLLGISTGNLPVLVETIGETAGSHLAREMLLNPRFQNLSAQMVEALNANKYAVAKTISKEMYRQLKNDYPEAAEAIKDINFHELEEKD